MRRLETQEIKEKKQKRNTLILSMFMLFLLVFSTLGFAFFSKPYTSSDNTPSIQTYQNQTEKLSINNQGQVVYLASTLAEIQDIKVNITKTPSEYSSQPLYIDASNQAVLREIASTIGRSSSRVQEACFGSCEEDFPEKNCTSNLIVWSDSSNNKVYQQDNCIFIEGDLKAVDAFIYNLFS